VVPYLFDFFSKSNAVSFRCFVNKLLTATFCNDGDQLMQKHSIKCATVAQFKIFVSLDISLRRFFVDGTSELSTKHRKDTALDFGPGLNFF
jgi:hypothetical protein